MSSTNTSPVLELRNLLKSHGYAAYIVPTEDAHQSEYAAACDARRSFISGFTGSAGTAVVTLDAAALWTDGRYYLQATNQLEKSWILQKTGEKTTPSQADWLVSVLPPSSQVAIDPSLFTVQTIHMLRATLQKAGHSLATHPTNLVDEIWTNRPAAPTSPIVVLDVKYAGKSFTEKLADLRAQLHAGKNWGVVINSLDEICWLFNLRGSDVSFNPVFLAYAIVTSSEAYIYTDLKKVTQSVRDATSGLVTFKEYGDIFNDLSVHGKSRMGQPETLYMDCNCNGALYESFGKAPVFGGKPLIQQAKAIKNATELEGFRQCHKRDGLALCRYFSWLENELVAKANKTLTEAQVADKLEGYRKELDKFVGLSFDTISSTGANGAVIHYKPEHGSCAIVDVNQIYLCDSGAQFLDGTTDTTRTFHFGTPTAEEKDAYTRVLQGHIQIDMLVFPEGTTGYIIDAIARAPLWKAGLDYMHGTGHGVGSYLNVHEGPHGIGFRISQNDTGLQAGMTVTDEPGFYKDGGFGIRIENILLVNKANTPNRFGNKDYLSFEHVTCCPIQTKMVQKDLMTAQEINWINTYNKWCLDTLGPVLAQSNHDKILAYPWLVKQCQPI